MTKQFCRQLVVVEYSWGNPCWWGYVSAVLWWVNYSQFC